MRRIPWLLAVVMAMGVASGSSCWAQGTLLFANSASTRVKEAYTGRYITPDMGYRVELLSGSSEDTADYWHVCYADFSNIPGIFNGGVVAIPGANPGWQPWLTIRIWHTYGGKFTNWTHVMSSVAPIPMGWHTWQLTTGLGGPNPPSPDILPASLSGFVAPTLQTYVLSFPPPPLLMNVRATGTQFQFEFDSWWEKPYLLWYRPSLDEGSAWTVHSGIWGDGWRMTVTVTNDPAAPTGFYAVEPTWGHDWP